MLNRINMTRNGHIITIEDPIEFIHKSQKCLVHQRQVGRDTKSFNDALALQNQIYAKMSEKGWYPAQQAQQTQIDAVKQKFSNQ